MISRTPRRPLARTISATVLASALAVSGAALGVVHAPAATAAPAAVSVKGKAATKSATFTNKKRKANGVRKLKRVKALDKVAKAQSRRMARSQRMHHNPNLARHVKNWCAVGENVAFDRTVRRANIRLWKSPGHRANMLNRTYDQVGIGVVKDRNGTAWVTQVFRKRC